MLKKIALLAALVITPTVASALTVGPNSITGGLYPSGTKTYFDTGAEKVTLDDLTNLTSAAMLVLEDAGYASTNKFGIYDLVTGNTLQVFAGTQSPTSFNSVTLKWLLDTNNNAWTVTNLLTNVSSQIGTTFGFYIDSNGDSNSRYFSERGKNDGNIDYFKLYDTSDHLIDGIGASDVVLGIEDLRGGDGDYNDMVVGVNDVVPTPEPGTMMLLGAGFLGLAIYGKRRKNA